jgi:hypothetical protein
MAVVHGRAECSLNSPKRRFPARAVDEKDLELDLGITSRIHRKAVLRAIASAQQVETEKSVRS